MYEICKSLQYPDYTIGFHFNNYLQSVLSLVLFFEVLFFDVLFLDVLFFEVLFFDSLFCAFVALLESDAFCEFE